MGSSLRGRCQYGELKNPCTNNSYWMQTFLRPLYTRNKISLKYVSYLCQKVYTETMCGNLEGFKDSVSKAKEVTQGYQ